MSGSGFLVECRKAVRTGVAKSHSHHFAPYTAYLEDPPESVGASIIICVDSLA
jgi:hypothetical protein